MNQILRTGVVGVGYLGKFHADKYAQLPNSNFVAVADKDASACQAIAEKYPVATFSNYADLIGKVDAVSIAAPTVQHFAITKFFLEHGVHVLVEKPFTTTEAEADILIQLAKQNRCTLMVGHLERFNPVRIAAQKFLKNPRFIESHRLAPFKLRGTDVNVVLDLMIHDIDLILSMVAAPIQSIQANGVAVLSKELDIVNARISFEDGCVANVTASRVSAKSERKMRIFQAENYLSLDFQNTQLTVCSKGKKEMLPGIPEILREEHQFATSDALFEEIKAFLQAAQNRSTPPVTGTQAKNALATAIYITQLISQSIYVEA